jgi:hypothetical protein
MRIRGELEIDGERGVIYFHTYDESVAERYGTVTILRIQGLAMVPGAAIDISEPQKVSYVENTHRPEPH